MPSSPRKTRPKTPAHQGYHMPAEWEPHAATWMSWPKEPGGNPSLEILPALARMIDALADSEPVHVNVDDADHEALARESLHQAGARTGHLTFHHIPTTKPWCRDHGPVFVVRPKAPQVAVIDWDYNARGFKHSPFDLDDAVPAAIAEKLGLPVFYPDMVLEGGSVEVNGAGLLITTRSCLLNPNRNPQLSRKDIETRLRDFLGVKQIVWLGNGIEGGNTDGHVDNLARFVAPHRVLTVVEEDEQDPNYAPLQENLDILLGQTTTTGKPLEVVALPMPTRLVRDGQTLAASYANFYIANKVVLLPVFHDTNDKWAAAVLEHAFPDRRIVPIDCRDLLHAAGAFHSLTQQQPLPPAS